MLTVVKWFKENVLKIKPIFRIKIERTWFSDDWFTIKFSNNNGWSWEYIVEKTIDVDYPYRKLMSTKKYISSNSIEDWSRELNTYKKCREHNDKVMDNIRKNNDFHRKTYIAKKDKVQKFIKKFNNE